MFSLAAARPVAFGYKLVLCISWNAVSSATIVGRYTLVTTCFARVVPFLVSPSATSRYNATQAIKSNF